jgi:hypothetical protein
MGAATVTPPCTLNSSNWELAHPDCKHCGHTGFLHRGGGGATLKHCMICSLIALEEALTQQRTELAALIDRHTYRTPVFTADYDNPIHIPTMDIRGVTIP